MKNFALFASFAVSFCRRLRKYPITKGHALSPFGPRAWRGDALGPQGFAG
jgi:hypothetical protein